MAKANKLEIQNRTIFCGDNMNILSAMDAGAIDLVYLDPPFNKKKIFSAPAGSKADGASFKDIFRADDVDPLWGERIECTYPALYAHLSAMGKYASPYHYCYCLYMAVRLIELHRILKDTGSLYLHCDPGMSHYLKIILDIIFGAGRFVNEIVWHYTGGGRSKRYFSHKHDIIFWYSKTARFTFNIDAMRVPYNKKSGYAKSGITAKSGKHYKPNPKGTVLDDTWDMPIINPMGGERMGYPTQKPLALLERIIKASSHAGDIILDPFCGSGTTCVAAESLGRKWIGIDKSKKACALARARVGKG